MIKDCTKSYNDSEESGVKGSESVIVGGIIK